MSITNDTITIAGNIGNDPTKNETRAGRPVTNFRVGSSSGYFDQRTGVWVDGGTNWYAVAAYGNLAEHAKASLHLGDPVIVSGRLKVREWEANGKKGIDVEIIADAIGHDLNRGTSAFARRPRGTVTNGVGSAETTDQRTAMEDADQTRSTEDGMPSEADRDAWAAHGLHEPTHDGELEGPDAPDGGGVTEPDAAYA